MSDKKATAKSDIDSGVVNTDYVKVLGGIPDKKSKEQIEKANTPGNAPGSARS